MLGERRGLRVEDGMIHGSSGDDPGPFCLFCYDTKDRLIHLYRADAPEAWLCLSCEHVFAPGRPPEPIGP